MRFNWDNLGEGVAAVVNEHRKAGDRKIHKEGLANAAQRVADWDKDNAQPAAGGLGGQQVPPAPATPPASITAAGGQAPTTPAEQSQGLRLQPTRDIASPPSGPPATNTAGLGPTFRGVRPDVMDIYRNEVVPKMVERMMGQGRYEDAEKFQAWADNSKNKAYMKDYIAGRMMLETGDVTGAVAKMQTLYNRRVPDGQVVNTELIDGGKMKVTFYDEKSKEVIRQFEQDPQSIAMMGAYALSPENAFTQFATETAAKTAHQNALELAQVKAGQGTTTMQKAMELVELQDNVARASTAAEKASAEQVLAAWYTANDPWGKDRFELQQAAEARRQADARNAQADKDKKDKEAKQKDDAAKALKDQQARADTDTYLKGLKRIAELNSKIAAGKGIARNKEGYLSKDDIIALNDEIKATRAALDKIKPNVPQKFWEK